MRLVEKYSAVFSGIFKNKSFGGIYRQRTYETASYPLRDKWLIYLKHADVVYNHGGGKNGSCVGRSG